MNFIRQAPTSNAIDFEERRKRRLVLDTFTVLDIREWERQAKTFIAFAQEVQNFYQEERAKRHPQLVDALRSKGRSLAKKSWYRCVQAKFVNAPLSAWGSLMSDPGGRFNIGNIDAKYRSFSALYLAEDFNTGLKEVLGAYKDNKPPSVSIDLYDSKLMAGRSFSGMCLNFSLSNVLDVTDAENLEDFTKIVARIKFPRTLREKARKLRLAPNKSVSNAAGLMQVLHDPYWRNTPDRVDVPSNSQFFGSLVRDAGIQGILYRSRCTGSLCVAVFPESLDQTDDWIELTDYPDTVKFHRVDSTNCHRVAHDPRTY